MFTSRFWSMLTLLLVSTTVFASGTRTLDDDQLTSSDHTKTWSMPAATDTIVGRLSTDTLTNKTLTSPTINAGALSGTFTGAPTLSGAAVLSGGPVISGAGSLTSAMNYVDAADATKKLIMSLSGITTANSVTLAFSGAAGTLTFPAGAGTIATLGATQTFGAGSTWNGVAIGAAFGGTGVVSPTTGSIYVGAGSSPMTAVAPGTSGNVLTSNGSTWTSAAASSAAATVTGTRASPTNVTAVGGIVFSGSQDSTVAFIQGNAGAVTVSASPQISAGSTVGQRLHIIGRSATNTVTIADGTGLSLNGAMVIGLDSVLSLIWDGTNWVEISRR